MVKTILTPAHPDGDVMRTSESCLDQEISALLQFSDADRAAILGDNAGLLLGLAA